MEFESDLSFSIPNAKRVRRSDLDSRSSSSSPLSSSDGDSDFSHASLASDQEQELVLQQNGSTGTKVDTVEDSTLKRSQDSTPLDTENDALASHILPSTTTIPPTQPEEKDTESYAFRLFTTSSAPRATSSTHVPASEPLNEKSEPSVTRIQLGPPDTNTWHSLPFTVRKAPPALLKARLGTPLAKLRAELPRALVTYSDIKRMQSWRYPGSERPWRIVHLTNAQVDASMRAEASDQVEASAVLDANAPRTSSPSGPRTGEAMPKKKHARPGKKTRLKRNAARETRKREEIAERVRKEAEESREAEKKEHIRDKKARLNRLRQHKKREKKRQEKAQGNGNAEQSADS